MEDNKKTTQVVETPTTTEKEANGGKTYSQVDLDNLAGKIRAEEKSKSEEAIKIAVANAIAEHDRLAKLTEEEKQKEAKSKYEAELKERENNITLRERQIQTQEMLTKEGISSELAEFLIDIDEDVTKSNVEKFTKTFKKAVESAVTDKLKGQPPTDFSNSEKDKTDRKKKIMSAF